MKLHFTSRDLPAAFTIEQSLFRLVWNPTIEGAQSTRGHSESFCGFRDQFMHTQLRRVDPQLNRYHFEYRKLLRSSRPSPFRDSVSFLLLMGHRRRFLRGWRRHFFLFWANSLRDNNWYRRFVKATECYLRGRPRCACHKFCSFRFNTYWHFGRTTHVFTASSSNYIGDRVRLSTPSPDLK